MLFLDNPSVDDQVYLSEVVEYYHQCLKHSQGALEYLQKRGIVHPELIDTHKLGFCDRSLGKLLPIPRTKKGDAIRQRLLSLGILHTTGHELFRGSFVLPIYDEHGNIVNIYGRKTGSGLRKDTPLHVYSSKEHRGVWNIDAVKVFKEVILSDSPINALILWCKGFRNVTCSLHGKLVSEDMVDAFKRFGMEKVTLAWRRKLGDTEEVLEQIKPLEDIPTFRFMMPVDEDVADHLANRDETAVQRLIDKAEWLQGEESEPVQEDEGDAVIDIADRTYKTRGLEKNLSPGTLKLTLSVSRLGAVFMDQLNLCTAKQRRSFIKQASEEVYVDESVLREDISKLIVELERRQERLIAKAMKPNKPKPVEVTDSEKAEALDLLKAPDLVQRILEDFEKCGVVGEQTNKLVGYIAATSRKLDDPLAIVVQSTSAAGKSSLMNGILSFLPKEDVVSFSAVTGQSIFYFAEDELKHKVLSIAEQEGGNKASYALKLLQSDGYLTLATTGKEEVSGRTMTQTHTVEGPVMLFQTTTEIDVDEELLNRCLVLTVDEGVEQTRAIHRVQRQRETLEGLLAKRERNAILKLHRNAQRLLRPMVIVNPYAEELSFLDSRTRSRRDHQKYLGLIRGITLLHQYQRQLKTIEHAGETVECIEVTPEDVELANKLSTEVLGRSLDELAPQTRRLLSLIQEMVAKACDTDGKDQSEHFFTRKDVIDQTGWSYQQVRVHLDRLVALEYILIKSGSKGQRMSYQLVYGDEPDSSKVFTAKLTDSRRLTPLG